MKADSCRSSLFAVCRTVFCNADRDKFCNKTLFDVAMRQNKLQRLRLMRVAIHDDKSDKSLIYLGDVSLCLFVLGFVHVENRN